MSYHFGNTSFSADQAACMHALRLCLPAHVQPFTMQPCPASKSPRLCRQRVSASFLPIDLLSMLQLERLSLSRCGILTLPLALYQLDRMQHLCIRNCRKVFFAEGAYMATTFIASHLESLTLAYCDMHILPAQVCASPCMLQDACNLL